MCTLARWPSCNSFSKLMWCLCSTGLSVFSSEWLKANKSPYLVSHASGMMAISPFGNLNSTFFSRWACAILWTSSHNLQIWWPVNIEPVNVSRASSSITALPTKYFITIVGLVYLKPMLSKFTRFSFNQLKACALSTATRKFFKGKPIFTSVAAYFSQHLCRASRDGKHNHRLVSPSLRWQNQRHRHGTYACRIWMTNQKIFPDSSSLPSLLSPNKLEDVSTGQFRKSQ